MHELPSKTKNIDGINYRVTVFPAGQGFELLYELKELLGESVGSLFGGHIELAIARLGGKMGKTEVLNFVLRLLGMTFVEGNVEPVGIKTTFDLHFAGRQGHLLKVIAFVVEVNFGDFIVELKNGIAALVQKLEKTLQGMGATTSPLTQSPKG